MNILIIGANGFLGENIQPLLEADNYTLSKLDRQMPTLNVIF